MDFYKVKTTKLDKRRPESVDVRIFPDFSVQRVTDLMVRGRAFYAVWDEARQLWSTDEYDVQRLVDAELMAAREAYLKRYPGAIVKLELMQDFSTNSWKEFKRFLTTLSDNFQQLDDHLTFADEKVTKEKYVSRVLPYSLESIFPTSWDELVGVLYRPNERAKIEWAIGSIVAGESKDIQKFVVLYGEAGGGKSTILNIIQKLFPGYFTMFDAKALTGNQNSFAAEVFRNNPLIGIQHDGDLSQIRDYTKLNSIISHEYMSINEKYKSAYTTRSNAFLFMGTNSPVKIANSKAGLIRRLIDVYTSGDLIPTKQYDALMARIDFELGAIANHCLQVYRKLGKLYYDGYRPLKMVVETDFFYNFMEEYFFVFRDTPQITLKRAYSLYKEFCTEMGYEYPLPGPKFRNEFATYFREYKPVDRIDGKQVRSVYSEFRKEMFTSRAEHQEEHLSLVLDSETSLLDTHCAEYDAQYATDDGIPGQRWDMVTTKVKDLDTSRLHFVRLPHNHIVIDFDIKDAEGNKSAELNLTAAGKWPPTYAEYSRSGKGIHLHYLYDGDPETLSRIFADGIEIKVSVGKSALRRQLSRCNTTPIATISGGLPLKEVKLLDTKSIQSEIGLRKMIVRNLRKEFHPGTKPSIDFIHKILEDSYNDPNLVYDVTDMQNDILTFAMQSTNQADYCVKLVSQMKFASEPKEEALSERDQRNDEIVFFDVEVFPNLFVVCWKYEGKDQVVRKMINPSPEEIETMINTMRLVGFNCRRYDNHILYARYLGYSNQELFNISSGIVSGNRASYFREAYGISFADIYDFSSEKKSLKAFEVELNLVHKELDLPWDEPVPEDLWEEVVTYCENDVIATEEVFKSRTEDFRARLILSELSGLSVNATTQAHTSRILFGSDRNPQDKFIYTDLSEEFPGYTFDAGRSFYRGEDPGEGGYVYAEPGMYAGVALLDIASMHPTSIEVLNLFGPYTANYSAIKEARLAIKHKDFDRARQMFDGKLAKYLDSVESADQLAYALKIVINIVYGLTSARFDNPFRDIRNKDNIVAKRGALFMIDLKHALQEKGIPVIHIKTDSVKIPNATQDQIDFVKSFGERYGYTFEHESTYKALCLVNNAVYVAKKADGTWTATGAEFIHPYVFKDLFSKEEITFDDLTEVKQVSSPSVIYLDMNEGLPDVSALEAEHTRRMRMKGDSSLNLRLDTDLSYLSDDELEEEIAKGHNYVFVGRIGRFCPMKPGSNGGIMYRVKEGRYYAVTGTKGWRWQESAVVKELEKENDIDFDYFETLVQSAKEHLGEFGDVGKFLATAN